MAYHHRSVTTVREGDAIIGADNREYLVETVEPIENNLYRLMAVSPDGVPMSTAVGEGAILKIVPKVVIIDEETPQHLGMRWCDRCKQQRSKARFWEEDDYVCVVCREELDLE